MAENIGFISTRFAGTDGVSLESLKWAKTLAESGHRCYWYAGRLDHPPEVSLCVSEALFSHPENAWIDGQIWGRKSRPPQVTERIHVLAAYLKQTLHEFIRRFGIDLLVLENAVSIPMHLPLGLALTELLAETTLPAIAHHHDFYWERSRFSVNAVPDYLDMCFPPRDPNLQHAVINEMAREELARRKAVSSILIPNVLDFAHPPAPADAYTCDLRAEMGLAADDVLILQPTRVVPRKGIEHAITLLKMLGNQRYKLVVTHEAGDEGYEYRNMLAENARQAGVDLRFFATRVSEIRQLNDVGKKMYTLWDIYPQADLVTYPSIYEGFGNALLEAIYYKKPVLVNRYAIFGRDIEPRGFKLPVMEGFLTEEVAAEVRRLLENPAYRQAITEHNYAVAARHYSYDVLRRCLRTLITNVRGLD